MGDLEISCKHLLPLETPLERIYVDPIRVLLNNVYSVMGILKILWDKSSQYHDL